MSGRVTRCPSCGCFYSDEQPACPRDGAQLQPSDGAVDRYHVMARLGQGSMGVVYRAQHTLLDDRVVAIKLLYRELARDPRIVDRFFREARAATAVQSPYIVEVVDFGTTTDGDAFLVMEHLDGPSLRDVMQREQILPLRRAGAIALQIADGLQAAHSKGIVHRDLKPENVVLISVQGQERVKLLDFGIAQLSEFKEVRLTETGIVLGTPAYMSPEQASGERVDHRTDIYSLGTILYEMLTGRTPFEGATAKELLIRKLTRGYIPPTELRAEIPLAVEAVILHALERRPEQRVLTMSELGQELADALGSATLRRRLATPVPIAERPGELPAAPEERPEVLPGQARERPPERSAIRRWLPLAGTAGGLILGIGLTLLFTRGGPSKPTAARDARTVQPPPRESGAAAAPDRVSDAGGGRLVSGTAGRKTGPGPRLSGKSKRGPGGRTPATKTPLPKTPATKTAPTAKGTIWAMVSSQPSGAEVYDEREARIGKTPLRVATDGARSLTLHRVGTDSRVVKIPARSTAAVQITLKASTMSWEVLSLTQLSQMKQRGQISNFTYQRRRTELIRKRDEKVFELKMKLRVGEITQAQYDRAVKSVHDSYR